MSWSNGFFVAAAAAWAFAAPVRAQAVWDGDDAAPSGPQARLELGADPWGAFGFKLIAEGGEPFARALLEVGEPGGATFTQLVELDELGGWSRVVIGEPPARDLAARFVMRTRDAAASTTNTVKIPSGHPAAPMTAQTGDVLVREFMKDPAAVSDSKGEWIEIVNRTNFAIDLNGWTLSDDGSNHHTIHGTGGAPVMLMPGVPFVLGNSNDPTQNGGLQVDYKYSSFTLGNGADQIVLRDAAGALADRVAYDDGIFWPDSAGRSISLSPSCTDAALADDPGRWCESSSPLSAANPDTGTPGGANDACP